MRRIYLFLTVILSTIIFLSFIQTTKSSFTSLAQSVGNSFSTSATFPTATSGPSPTPTNGPTPTTSQQLHVVINELIPQASNSAEWVEVYNPISSAIDISGWTLTNKNNNPSTIPLNSSIPGTSYAVIVTTPTTVIVPVGVTKIQLSSTSIASGLVAGNDKLILKNSGGTIIDQLSWGTNTDIFNLPSPTTTKTLSRIPNGIDTDTASDWIATASATLGGAN